MRKREGKRERGRERDLFGSSANKNMAGLSALGPGSFDLLDHRVLPHRRCHVHLRMRREILVFNR